MTLNQVKEIVHAVEVVTDLPYEIEWQDANIYSISIGIHPIYATGEVPSLPQMVQRITKKLNVKDCIVSRVTPEAIEFTIELQ